MLPPLNQRSKSEKSKIAEEKKGFTKKHGSTMSTGFGRTITTKLGRSSSVKATAKSDLGTLTIKKKRHPPYQEREEGKFRIRKIKLNKPLPEFHIQAAKAGSTYERIEAEIE